jgi:hypothetical protein
MIDAHLTALSLMGVPRGVPCHLDFQPRNWLVNTCGDLSLVDFEHARVDLPVRDLVRLRFRIWPDRPALREAFLTGYGRPLTPDEDQLSWHMGALDAAAGAHLAHFGSDSLLVKSPFNSFRIARLEQHWGIKAKYIHIIRDQHETADSMVRNRFEFATAGRQLDALSARELFVSAVETAAPADRTITIRRADMLRDPGGTLGVLARRLVGAETPSCSR